MTVCLPESIVCTPEGRLSCVGRAEVRFKEDASLILSLLRFSAVHGLPIEADTEEAIHSHAGLVATLSADQVREELCQLLGGRDVLRILLEYSDVMAALIPELGPCIGFDQNSRYHQYTVYDHIAHVVANYTGTDPVINVALLLHDIGKPDSYTENETGGHFYGHGAVSERLAGPPLDRLGFDERTKALILELIGYHNKVLDPTREVVQDMLDRIGPEQFARLLEVRLADIRAHSEDTQASRLERRAGLCRIFAEIMGDTP